MPYETALQTYFKALGCYSSKTDNELTYRTDLQNFLRAACTELRATVEPRQEVKDSARDLGVPDFSFINAANLGVVGLLENKAMGVNIEGLIASAQIQKYRRRSENILLTNYLDWLLLRDGVVTHRASLGTIPDAQRLAPPDPEGVADLRRLLQAFLAQEPRGIGRKQELAEQLASRCHDLRDFLTVEMARQRKAKETSPLGDMYEAFRKYVDGELTPEEFTSAFAQTLGYSLFLAKLNVEPVSVVINLYNVQKFIPSTFGLIKALANFLKELEEDAYRPIRYRVEEILGMMNHLDLAEITRDLSFNKRLDLPDEEARLFERDPYIYFYEHFLHEYDATMKESRGVYYTPPPVVNFIIRGVNAILKQDFGITDGLADARQVQLLDFATGTGTFILEALLQMFEDPAIAASKAIQTRLVKDHILKNMYGFEYLIAPYTIAHLKLSQFLKDKGFALDEPLKVFLTNTLDMRVPQGDFPFMQKLKAEGEAAHRVKDMPIRVIVGNPPYNVKSKNSGAIDDLVKDAYAPEGEKKMNWDDYVKFIRFAHNKMEKIDRGVIGIITNNSWLNAVTLRQMRNRLMRDFNAIYILNLHGNSLIGEQAPDGRQDSNVFDIRVGTCIALFVKTERKPKACRVAYADIQASKRVAKYKHLVQSDMRIFEPLDVAAFNHHFAATRWAKRFAEPLSFFVPSSDGFAEHLGVYGDFWGITDIFEEYGSGVKTDRDGLVIAYEIDELSERMRQAFSDHHDYDFRRRYAIENSSSYDFKDRLQKLRFDAHSIRPILYHPFDARFIYYKLGFTSRPAWKVMKHLFAHDSRSNFGLIIRRQLPDTAQATYVTVTDIGIVDGLLGIDNKGRDTVCPLYLYPPRDSHGDIVNGNGKHENFQPAFRAWLDKTYGTTFTPEQVLGYMYAVLHSPAFRQRYQEFLKIDFPRIPFVKGVKAFERLATLGWALIQAHTLKTRPSGVNVTFPEDGDNKVTNVAYDPATRRLFINKTQYFGNVPPEAWAFIVGGYQVLDKYLKERKKADRPLSLTDLQHIPNVIRILAFTHAQMQVIDGVLGDV